jgi:uncharacterized membrane protein
MNKAFVMIAGTGVGAGLMYFFDPDKGRRRRALLHDKWLHTINKTADAVQVTARDIRNRSYRILAESRHWFSQDGGGGQTLEERVRAEIGAAASHPHAVKTTVNGGTVVLSGPILAGEVDALLARVSRIPGVDEIDNRLEAHQRPGSISALQGAPARRRRSGIPEILQSNWSPALRFFSGIVGGWLLLYGSRHGGLRAMLASAAGVGLFARGVANKDLKRVFGLGAGTNAITVRKTIHIKAPVERVFDLWSNYENFPRFMSRVQEVRRSADNRSHWVVAGPAGMPIEWNAVMTRSVPNEEIAWRTEPGSIVEHAGRVRFARANGDATRVDIELTYNPGIGALGHGVAVLLGADPKSEMNADLMRMKSFIETGHLPRDAAKH